MEFVNDPIGCFCRRLPRGCSQWHVRRNRLQAPAAPTRRSSSRARRPGCRGRAAAGALPRLRRASATPPAAPPPAAAPAEARLSRRRGGGRGRGNTAATADSAAERDACAGQADRVRDGPHARPARRPRGRPMGCRTGGMERSTRLDNPAGGEIPRRHQFRSGIHRQVRRSRATTTAFKCSTCRTSRSRRQS